MSVGLPRVDCHEGDVVLRYEDGMVLRLEGMGVALYVELRETVAAGRLDDPLVREFVAAVRADLNVELDGGWDREAERDLLEVLGMPVLCWLGQDEEALRALLDG